MRLINPDRGVAYVPKNWGLRSRIVTFKSVRDFGHRISRYLSSSSLTGSFENIYESGDFRWLIFFSRGVTMGLINPDRAVSDFLKSQDLRSRIITFR